MREASIWAGGIGNVEVKKDSENSITWELMLRVIVKRNLGVKNDFYVMQ